jgi:hypothetical protein
MKKKQLILVLAIPLLLFSACTNPLQDIIDQFNKSPDIGSFTRAVKVSLPLAYAASVAMDAMKGVVIPGVTVVRPPSDSFPCMAIVRIAVNPSHPLPIGSTSVTGDMMVTGLFADTNTAVVSVFFTQTNIRDGTFLLKDVAFVPVTRDDSLGTMVVFASEDVNMDSSIIMNTTITPSFFASRFQGLPTPVTDSSIAVHQQAWITYAKRQPQASLGSETYTLYGASQSIGLNPSATEVIQMVMLAVQMKPSVCRLNPLESTLSSGYAMIRDLKINGNSDIEMGTTILSFKNACSGTATILLATGNYIAKTGSTVALNLDK